MFWSMINMNKVKIMMAFAAWWMLWMTAVPAMGQQRQPKTAAKEQAKHQTAKVNVRGSVMESDS